MVQAHFLNLFYPVPSPYHLGWLLNNKQVPAFDHMTGNWKISPDPFTNVKVGTDRVP